MIHQIVLFNHSLSATMLRPNQVCFMTETFPISQGQAIEDRRCPGTALCGLSACPLSLVYSCSLALSHQAVTFALSHQAVVYPALSRVLL